MLFLVINFKLYFYSHFNSCDVKLIFKDKIYGYDFKLSFILGLSIILQAVY
jgi:hypothetical protein